MASVLVEIDGNSVPDLFRDFSLHGRETQVYGREGQGWRIVPPVTGELQGF
jgi:hypothetical protein